MILKAPLSEHARLGASGAHRWMRCAGSVRLAAGLPATDEDYQREGTAAHALAAYWLGGGEPSLVMAVDVQRPNAEWAQVEVTDEMRDAVEVFVTTVGLAVLRTGRPWPEAVQIERTFDLAPLDPPEPMFGTGDAVVTGGRALHVLDFKYGQGVVVEVLENEQLCMYVVGAVVAAGMAARTEVWAQIHGKDITALDVGLSLFDEISVTVVQPRAAHRDGPVRTERLTHDQVRAFAAELLERARATQAPDAPLTPGDWCKFCPAKGHCPALQAAAQEVAQVVFADVPVSEMPAALPQVEHLPIEVAAEMLQRVPILEEWVRALRGRVEDELNQGKPVPGFKLVAKRGRRQWVDSDAEVSGALARMGLDVGDIFHSPELKSPAQIEKVVGRNHLPADMTAMVSGGFTVAPESDPRPGVRSLAAEVFPALPPGPAADTQIGESQ